MVRIMVQSASIIFGILLVIPAVFFSAIAWGQWQCGLNELQLVTADVLAALGVSLIMLGYRGLRAQPKKMGVMHYFLPWFCGLAISGWTVFLAPQCPFISR